MNVDELLKVLERLSKAGNGDFDVNVPSPFGVDRIAEEVEVDDDDESVRIKSMSVDELLETLRRLSKSGNGRFIIKVPSPTGVDEDAYQTTVGDEEIFITARPLSSVG